jgi:hypothetical protein
MRTSYKLIVSDADQLIHSSSDHVLCDNDRAWHTKHLSEPSLTLLIPDLWEVPSGILECAGHVWKWRVDKCYKNLIQKDSETCGRCRGHVLVAILRVRAASVATLVLPLFTQASLQSCLRKRTCSCFGDWMLLIGVYSNWEKCG